MSAVSEFVAAYRDLGCPASWKGSSFSFSTSSHSDVIGRAIEALFSSKAGRFSELVVDDYEINPDTFSRFVPWNSLQFTFTVDMSGAVPIFQSFEKLIDRTKSLSRGINISQFYIVEEDILSSDSPVDKRVIAIERMCELISLLSDLAHYHDSKGGAEYKLVFMAENFDGGERAITVQPYFSLRFLSCEFDVAILNALHSENSNKAPQFLKERSIFRVSLIEYLSIFSGGKERFESLVLNWHQFIDTYENNLSTYLSGFSFHKAKQEVAAAQLSIADQLSKVVGDISGKILSVPVSLAAVIAISKADGVLESSLIVLGITLASALLGETLAAQKSQYERIKHSRTIIFNAHEQKIRQYPKDLQGFIKDATEGLRLNERRLGRSLQTLRFICWIPALVAITLHGFTYGSELERLFDSVLRAVLYYPAC